MSLRQRRGGPLHPADVRPSVAVSTVALVLFVVVMAWLAALLSVAVRVEPSEPSDPGYVEREVEP